MPQLEPMKQIAKRYPERMQAIDGAIKEADGGGFVEIFGADGHFGKAELKMFGLKNHLGVEGEVVGVAQKGDSLE